MHFSFPSMLVLQLAGLAADDFCIVDVMCMELLVSAYAHCEKLLQANMPRILDSRARQEIEALLR